MNGKTKSLTMESLRVALPKIASRADVARLAGVTPAAVSQVLNNLPNTRISPAVREKILSAARDLGYRPNSLAKALAAGRTSIIGVLIFHVGSPFGEYTSHILNASWSGLKQNSYKMLIDGKEVQDTVASHFREESWCDGYILIAPPLSLRGAQTIPMSPYASVCVGSRPDGVPVSYTDMDNALAARMAVSYLFEKGHRKIAHISGPVSQISSASDRRDGYVDALKGHGLSFSKKLMVEGDYRQANGRTAMAQLLDGGEQFTAVFAANDAMAWGAMEEARSRGLRIPGDISVMGVDDSPPLAGGVQEQITTIRQPLEKIGAEAAAILLKHLSENPKSRQPTVKLFSGEIIERATVAVR